MSDEVESDAQLEIGHVLFMDIVGFSKLLVDQQSSASKQLNDIVRNTPQFRAAESAGKLMRLPTGDGMVLVFFSGPEAPAKCAVEVARQMKDASFGLRMGIHSGPVNKVSDVNDRSNVAGTGINIAQRVMDCGDAGHILVSKRVAEDLEQHSRWRPLLHELGQFEVKHGVRVDVVNLYSDAFGNPTLPARLAEKQPVPRRRSVFSLTILVLAALLAVAVSAGIYYFRGNKRPGSVVATIFPGKSIAVLPFKPLVATSRDEILEAGMADTLISKLSSSHELIVPSLMAVRKYDDEKHDSIATGRALGVSYVLEGSVQKLGDRIRVTARLINTADGKPVWSGKPFDEKFTDVFTVQDSIAEKVAAALAVPLNEEERKRLTKHYTDNTEAYQLYLRGRFHWNRYTEEGFRKSIEFFKQATEKDPTYALAYAGLADTYSLLGDLSYAPPRQVFELARTYADKAIALDDALGEAHLSLGIVRLFYDWDLVGSERELRRAKELSPHNPQVYHFYGHYLELAGRFDEAIVETKRGVDMDSTNLILNNEYAWSYYLAHRFDEAITLYRKNLELDPTFYFSSYALAQSYQQKGKFEEARIELNRVRPLSGDWSWIVAELGCVEAATGKTAEAEKILNELIARTGREYIDPVLIAYIYMALGDKDQAFMWLEKGFQDKAGDMPWLKIEPKVDPLRGDPRFADLLRRMGLD
ncbi:MAG TPA: adenylate/guanylate cyclase domain-containing protein [Chthoniobacterales bacterium]|nr:adenylate/guanylate cyclase domain-containing protein [Chthoniobacterales bacterium]